MRIPAFAAVMLCAASIVAAEANLKVTTQPACEGEISPMQYGQFVEYLCDLVPGMWAEKLYDTSFEGLSAYKFVFIKETDFKEKPWYPCGATNRAVFTLDRENKVSGETAQRIRIADGPPCTVGIAQDGIWLNAGAAATFTCAMRSSGIAGKVRLRISRDGQEFVREEFDAAEQWKTVSARIVAKTSVEDATLSIEFRGPGTLWLDNASLMPEDNVGGWRADVVRAVKELKPGVIRFGGSALEGGELGDFEWKETIGPVERRKPFRAWGGLQPMGAGLEELVQFCRAVEAEPLICVRFNNRAAKDAADEVEYFNGTVNTPMGALRAKNGHAEPYGIKLWQVGNEIGSPAYAEQAGAFSRAMKAVDPSINVLASFPTRELMEQAGDAFDFVCPHHYSRDLAGMERSLIEIGQMIRDQPNARSMKIAVTEWNTTAGDAGPARAMLWSLENALACSRYHNLLHRHCDLVQIANRSNLTNSFCSGIIQTDRRGRLYKTPTYYAQQLYATLAKQRPMKVEGDATGLDVSATASADGGEVAVFVVNPSLAAASRELDFSAFGTDARHILVKTLADSKGAGEPDVANRFAEPRRIGVIESNAQIPAGGKLAYRFEPLTLTVLRWAKLQSAPR